MKMTETLTVRKRLVRKITRTEGPCLTFMMRKTPFGHFSVRFFKNPFFLPKNLEFESAMVVKIVE